MTKYIGSMIAILLAFTPLSFAQTPKAKQAEKAKSTIEEKLIAEEKRVVWEAVVKKEIKVLQDFFANEFLDVSDVGVFTKSETIKLIPDLDVKDYSLDKFKVIMPNKETAIVTYEAIQHWTINGKDAPSHVRASSIWINRSGKWLITFHQESTLNQGTADKK